MDVISSNPDVLWLDDPRSANISMVGAKAAHLSRLSELKSVPPGFCITADAYRRSAMTSWRLSVDLRGALHEKYQSFSDRYGVAEPRFAVRSSAVDEDGPTSSFAGQHETYLNVVDFGALVEAVERCWASARTEPVLDYRRQRGLPVDDIRLAVLVQQLVVADVSGIAFSANPVTGSHDEIVITASWGLGESIVGGTVTPDSWTVHKKTLEIVGQQLGDKQQMTVAVAGGTKEVDVPRLLRGQPSLSEKQVREIAEFVIDLEQAMGWPVDIECAFGGERLYLLQCRPITALGSFAITAGSDTDRMAAD